MMPTATLLWAGLLGLLHLVLTVRVLGGRYRTGTGIGDGGDPMLARAIRVHANFAEYVPLILVLLALLEAAGWSRALIHGMGAALLAARIAHALGLWRANGRTIGRAAGFSATFLILLAVSVLAIATALG
ncbi:MAG: MAPEG family protein [Alphaproteobacteria bacterium]